MPFYHGIADQQWMLPHDFPPWSTVYYYCRRWRQDGTLAKSAVPPPDEKASRMVRSAVY